MMYMRRNGRTRKRQHRDIHPFAWINGRLDCAASQRRPVPNVPISYMPRWMATGSFIGEGFDEPRLDTLFLAMPISWKGTLQQYAGRLHRLFADKKEVQIYDYVDIRVRMLERMYQKRLTGYASMGYKAKSDDIMSASLDIIFDKDSFCLFSAMISPVLRKKS